MPNGGSNEPEPWETLTLYGDVFAGLGDAEKALASYERGIDELETRRRLLSRDELKTALANGRGPQNLYFRAACTAVDLQCRAEKIGDTSKSRVHAARAFRYAEGAKARALLDLMVGTSTLARSTQAEGRAARSWREATARVTAWRSLLAQQLSRPEVMEGGREYLERQIETAQDDLRRAEAELAIGSPEFSRTVNPQADLMSADEIGSALPPDAVLLQYYLLDSDMLAWAITRQGLVRTRRARVNVDALARQVGRLHRACRGRAPFADTATRLAAGLLEPFSEVIDESSYLIVVPYGAMHLLPFHALPWRGEPLIATRTVSYLPSSSTLRLLGSSRAGHAAERILAIGNPARMAYRPPLGGESLPQDDLPWAGAEAAYVAGLFPRGEALLGGKATKAAVQDGLHAYSLLHFATHGVLSEEAPMLASLLLAEGEALTLYELLGQRLDADLVVASACDTGRGMMTGGDDVFGLTRGLLAAGARSAIVSLWSVNDASTSLLMSHLYRCVRAGDAPAVALQRAQNTLRSMNAQELREELADLASWLAIEAEATAPDQAPAQRLRHAGPKQSSPAWQPADLQTFDHPFHWAAFFAVGGFLKSAGPVSRERQCPRSWSAHQATWPEPQTG